MSEAISLSLPSEPAVDRLPDAVARMERDNSRVVLIRDGKPVAALVPVDDLRALEEMDEAEDAWLQREADAARARWEAEERPPLISHEEICREFGIDPAGDPNRPE